MASYRFTRRGFWIFGIILLSSIGLLVYLRWHNILAVIFGPRTPPLYEKVRTKEESLPHYKEYERNTVKYFLAANHYHSSGWGNVMQDYVMMGLLAHTTNRSFAFNDYVWNPDSSLYSDYNGKQIPSRIPLSALVGGPTVGGTWPPGDRTPLSVSREFFHKVCPNPTVLSTSIINTEDVRFNDGIPASYLFEKWVEKINSIEDPCLMLEPDSPAIFEYWRNHHIFKPTETTFLEELFGSRDENMSSPVSGLLTIHVHRGDFKDHCVRLANWSSDWNTFNSFPEFDDKFDRPTDGGRGETSDKNMELYIRRCYPTIEQIVEKVSQVQREAANPLRYLYIMTNGPVAWVEELKSALARNMSWDHIGSSRDLKLTWEQKFIAQVLDMYVAQRAQVFIGNGWSSLTSNVVMLRMAKGFEPNMNRFW